MNLAPPAGRSGNDFLAPPPQSTPEPVFSTQSGRERSSIPAGGNPPDQNPFPGYVPEATLGQPGRLSDIPRASPSPSGDSPFPAFPPDIGLPPVPTPITGTSSLPREATPTPINQPVGSWTPDEATPIRRSDSIPRSSIPAFPTPEHLNAQTTDPSPSPVTPTPTLDPALAGTGTLEGMAPAGMQQPELQIEKDAPPRAVLNQPLVYNIRVRNVGRSAAHQVIVEDSVPRGSTLVGTNPGATQDPKDKHLIWELGSLEPGAEKLIRVQIVPTEPGEIGSVATVRFVGRIAARTVITAPRLKLELTGPAETAVGDTPAFRYRITNEGDGDADHVIVQCTIPSVLQHPSGAELENDIGLLRAGESREIDLTVAAVRPGRETNTAVVLLGGREHDRAAADVNVLASRLSVERTGPERRFVNRAAAYTTQVTNQSTQPLRNVTVVEQLPVGMELAAVPEHGRYDAPRRMIIWTLPELGPQETRQFRSSLVTADPGSYASTIKVWDAAGNRAEASSQLQVAGFSSLKVDVSQTTHGGGEVAVGEQVALRMTVTNRGSAAASDVITEFEIPAELEFVAARPDRYTLDTEARKIRFDAIPLLEVNGEQVIDIVCVAKSPGTPRVAASLWSKEQNPIRQEEAVVVFRDN